MRRTIILDPADIPAPVEAPPDEIREVSEVAKALSDLGFTPEQLSDFVAQQARDAAAPPPAPIGQPIPPLTIGQHVEIGMMERELSELRAMLREQQMIRERQRALDNEQEEKDLAASAAYNQQRHANTIIRTGQSVGKSTTIQVWPSMPQVKWQPSLPPLPPQQTQLALDAMNRQVDKILSGELDGSLLSFANMLNPGLLQLSRELNSGKTNDNPWGPRAHMVEFFAYETIGHAATQNRKPPTEDKTNAESSH